MERHYLVRLQIKDIDDQIKTHERAIRRLKEQKWERLFEAGLATPEDRIEDITWQQIWDSAYAHVVGFAVRWMR